MSDFAVLQAGTPLLSRLHRITVPTPFAVGPVHAYLAEGDPLTLVDTGPDTEDALAALQGGLAGLGYDVSDVQRIVITHSH
ncbi:MAG: MBL fold metallo-hydrolase, partial [Anaerolineae bacterium]|nr:MBL fold metallo-hydrolase [Anaerolineae bacterium]